MKLGFTIIDNNNEMTIFLQYLSFNVTKCVCLVHFNSSLINIKFRADLSPVNDTTLSDVEGEMTKTMWTVAFSFIMVGSILGNSLVLWAVLGRNLSPLLSFPREIINFQKLSLK